MFFETTIMEKTADLAIIHKTNIDALHKEGKSQRVITERCGCYRVLYQNILNAKLTGRKNWVGKGAQATGMTASLRIQSSKADSNTWESFTRSGLKLESVHQESPRSDVFRKRATKPLLNQRQRQKRLTWAVEKKNSVVQSPLLLSCFLLLTSFMEMRISFSSRTWHLPTVPKVPKAGSKTMSVCIEFI